MVDGVGDRGARVNHGEIQEKLRRELDTVLGPGRQITEPDTHRLPYLQAVVKETLRLRMAIPLLVPHMNLRDAELAGYGIPAESKVLVKRVVPRQRPRAVAAAGGVPAGEVPRGGEERRGQRQRLQVPAVRRRAAELPRHRPRAAHPRRHHRPPRPELRAAAAAREGQGRHHREGWAVQPPHPEALHHCRQAESVLECTLTRQ